MTMPPRFYKEGENGVCKLKKPLYGLKQSTKSWFERFAKEMKKQACQHEQSDHTMFFRYTRDGKKTTLIVYELDIT